MVSQCGSDKNYNPTLIGVLASHDDNNKNNDLARVFEKLWDDDKEDKKLFHSFHFIFTGGTFERIILGIDKNIIPIGYMKNSEGSIVENNQYSDLVKFLNENSTTLPDRRHGGVTILANLIVQRQCSILWPFLSPITVHWLNPENLALIRLCDIWNVKRLMNRGSVETWFCHEAARDASCNPQSIDPSPRLNYSVEGFCPYDGSSDPGLCNLVWTDQWSKDKDYKYAKERSGANSGFEFSEPIPKKRKPDFWLASKHQTLALIAHDAMKERMVNFAIKYERELAEFGRILSTGTTGKEVENATRKLSKIIKRCRSGPKGGDIEIATEILYGRCDVVIFFIDPLHPHPHLDDIRVVFAACMIESEVLMLTNEVEASEWMDAVVRPSVTKQQSK